jgi:type II secretory pathway pseudopilin PulG
MTIALVIIAILLFLSVINLQKFMRDMAVAERELLREIREMKSCLIKINEKQL